MAGFAPIQMPNFASAALGGYTAGQALGAQRRKQEALATYAKDPDAGIEALTPYDPALAEQLQKNRDRREERAALADAFTPVGIAPQNQALGAPVTRPEGTSPLLPPNAQPTTPPQAAAPVLPPQPPQRADGLTINQDALHRLFRVNPTMALQIRKFAAEADKARIEQVQMHAELKAMGAIYLKKFPAGPERAAAFERTKPDLVQRGFAPADLEQARLDDLSLDKDIAFGMGLKDIVSNDREDRKEAAANADRAADNARADAGLGIRREALEITRSRAASKAGALNYGAMDEAALMAIITGQN